MGEETTVFSEDLMEDIGIICLFAALTIITVGFGHFLGFVMEKRS